MTTAAPPEIRKHTFRAMGSQILAAVESGDRGAADALAAVPDWFEAWEQALSRFRADSELSRLNAAAGGPAVPVSAVLWEVLRLALAAARYTGGLITPTVLGALEGAGYDRTFEALKAGATAKGSPANPPQHGGEALAGVAGARRLKPPLREARRSPAAPVPSWRAVRLVPATRAVALPAGVRLDFGGVAKGWAAARAAAWLAPFGPALVDAGGDIAVAGPPPAAGAWPIGVEAPLGGPQPPGSDLAVLAVAAGGVATSGRDYRTWLQNGARRHHLIDPRTGAPARTDVLAATVVGPTVTAAEIGAKVAFLLGSAAGAAWIDARPGLAALLVLEGGQVRTTRRFGDYLWENHRAPQRHKEHKDDSYE